MSENTNWESFKAGSSEVLGKLRDIIAEGNVRRIRIKQAGQTVAEFPLTVGVVGAVLAPILAAIGALVALLTECTIEVERVEAPDKTDEQGG